MSEVTASRKMTREEYRRYRADVVEKYRIELVNSGFKESDEAEALAEAEVDRLLPKETVCEHLHIMANGQGEEVGFLWYEKRQMLETEVAFIYDLFIYESFRRAGYGRMILTYLAERSELEGFRKLVLNVFSKNTAANALYEQLGFEVLAESAGQKAMVKHL
ncbi:GNAT family N-acetyltransferase [Gorillibacterium sp. CAU 1737]|uniref:GNAT family N-acetyltransferase n=1 Tax=Gorillibacterium sp. CAU 1737 TaxID=3140362 RepID=UPI003260E6CF